jgi:hypothetical protein
MVMQSESRSSSIPHLASSAPKILINRVFFTLWIMVFTSSLFGCDGEESSRATIAGEEVEMSGGALPGADLAGGSGQGGTEMAGEMIGGMMGDEFTYYQDIKPILDTRCVHCHTPNGAGLFDLSTYESARMWAPAIVEATQNRSMPPWGAFETEDCTPSRPWVDDQRLSEGELERLAGWASTGTLEGDPDQTVEGEPFRANQLSRVDFEGKASAAVEVPPGGDSFVCVVIDPELMEETWIKGIEFIPDNQALVHHVVLFTDPTRASLERMDENGTYPCFGSAGVPGSVAAAWAPGIQPNILPPDHAMRVAPGSLFVMQMHYSPQGGAGDFTDQTTLRFEFADEPPIYEVLLQLMGNFNFTVHPALGLQPDSEEIESSSDPEFIIPSGSEEHRELLRWTYTGELPGTFEGGGSSGLQRLKLLSAAPHMHYAGVDMRVSIDRPSYGEAACEAGSLNGFFGCANREGCLQDDEPLTCLKTACEAEWARLSLSCWGCAHRVFTGGGDTAQALAQINACERPEESRMSGPEEPTRECLVSAPKYSFEWQRAYSYDVPLDELPTFMPGDVLSIECRYQNNLDNPLMREALGRAGESEPSEVLLGDETLDEMCLVGLLFAFERVE